MPPPIQFGIRHLLALTAVVAVTAAILAPFVRAWNTNQQTFFAIYVTSTLLLLAGSTCSFCRRRVRIERTAGELIMRTWRPGARWQRVQMGVFTAFFVAIMIRHWVVLSAHTESCVGTGPWLAAIIYTFTCALGISYCLTLSWWKTDFHSIDFCERGLIFGAILFLPYSKLKHYRWSPYSVTELNLAGRFGTSNVEIPPDRRSEIIDLLDLHGVPRAD